MAADAKTLAKAKKQYELGKSLRDIGKDFGVSYQAVFQWAEKGNWVKNALLTKIEQQEEKNVIALAAKVGVTHRRVLEKISEFLEAQKVVRVKDNPDEGGEPKDYTIEVPDWPTQIKGNEQAISVLKMAEKDNNLGPGFTPIMIRMEGENNTTILNNVANDQKTPLI